MVNLIKTGSLRGTIFLLLILAFLLAIGYKLFEWTTLKTLSQLHRKTEVQELALTEEGVKLSKNVIDLVEKIFLEENVPLEETLGRLDELQGETRLAIDRDENYLNTIKENQARYTKLKLPTTLLVGKRGAFARQLLSSQDDYYKNEIIGAEETIVEDCLFLSMFVTVMKDRFILDDFSAKTEKSPEVNYSKYFDDIAVLEKYTRDDFKFQNEDRIKDLYPYGYEILTKNRRFMGSFYLVAKDYVAGDLESAAYKYSRLKDEWIELSVDLDRLFREGESRTIKRGKAVLDAGINKIKLIKHFKEGEFGAYPLLSNVGGWKEDLIQCQLYEYKSGLYNTLTSKYPEAQTFEELLIELSQVSPKTDVIDDKFDKSVIRFTNDEESIKFECVDKENNRAFIFQIFK